MEGGAPRRVAEAAVVLQLPPLGRCLVLHTRCCCLLLQGGNKTKQITGPHITDADAGAGPDPDPDTDTDSDTDWVL